MHIQPYLNFDGRCEEAIEFYKRAIGATVLFMMRMKDSPEKPPKGMEVPGSDDKIMHASLRIGDSVMNASDGRCTGSGKFDGISLSLNAGNDAEAARLFKALGDGGQIQMPMSKTFFASSFGMVTDRFGVMWMVIAGQQAV